jgi:hypothetical protein
MIKFYTRGREYSNHEFESLVKFDGRTVEGNNFLTVLPISSKEYREKKGPNPVFVQFWQGETHSEFVVTDDWGTQHVLLLPNEMKESIEESKRNIFASDIPHNIMQ